MERMESIDLRAGNIGKQPPLDKKCRTCKKTKLLHEFDLYNNKRDTSCKDLQGEKACTKYRRVGCFRQGICRATLL